MRVLNILLGCEESQAVCKEFRKLGHNAYSNDIIPCSGGHPEWHLQMDIFEAINSRRWDLLIAFPPCTYLASSGLHWNRRVPGRSAKTSAAVEFVKQIAQAPIEMIAIENPVGCLSTLWRKPDQIIQPWYFGDDASKKTCLWLKGLPLLRETNRLPGDNTTRRANQTASGQNKLGPSPTRALERSKTYPGIAKAMANQWGAQL